MSLNHHEDMAAALAEKGAHTFRHGAITVTIDEYEYTDRMLTVKKVSAAYMGVPVLLDPPFHFVDAVHNGDPLGSAYQMISDVVRRAVG